MPAVQITEYPKNVIADRTNGRSYATVLRPSVCLSSVVCNVCTVAKWCVLPITARRSK